MGESGLNVLLLLGLVIFFGSIGGDLFSRLNAPRVVAYMLIGALVGRSGLKIIDESAVALLSPFNYFAVALVGFIIGGELKKEVFRKYGRSLLKILLFEGMGAFTHVFLLVASAGYLLLGDLRAAVAIALILGAIAAAADPASQTEVIRESRAKGPLTTNILGIIALSDALAIILFAFASSIAGRLVGFARGEYNTLLRPVFEIKGAVALGLIAGLAMAYLAGSRHLSRERMAGIAFGLILLVSGISITLGLDLILAVMCLGMVLSNMRPEKSRSIFKAAGAALTPIFILFFVLMGASVDFGAAGVGVVLMAALYTAGAAGGKILGTRLGAAASGAHPSVVKYLPYCLFAQAGVAVGLTILAVQNLPQELGAVFISIIAPAVFVLQIVGPIFTKASLVRAGEAGLDVTEEYLLENIRVGDIPGASAPAVHEDTALPEILRLFSEGENLAFGVVSGDNKLLGLISVEGIKYAMAELELGPVIIAADIMEPAPAAVSEGALLSEAIQTMDRYDMEYIPVAGGDGMLKGMLERSMLRKFVSLKLTEMKNRISALEAGKARA